MTSVLPGDGAAPAQDDLSSKLEVLVRTHIDALTASHAVDEANGDVLDEMIDKAVAQHQDSIDGQAIHRKLDLRRQVVDLRAAQQAASITEDEALALSRALAARIHSLRSTKGTSASSGGYAEDPSSAVDVGQLRTYVQARRSELKQDRRAALRAVRIRSSSKLAVATQSAARRAEAAARKVTDRADRHRAATEELTAALGRFRGPGLAQSEVSNGLA